MKKSRFLNRAEFEARTAKRNHFSAVDVLGSFDFSTAVIYLKSLKIRDIENAGMVAAKFEPKWNNGNPNLLSASQYASLAKVNPLAIHEYTHFVDSTSTLWGLRHLKLMSEAYSSLSEPEAGYYKAKIFFDHTKSIRLPSYYTVINKVPHGRQPWRAVPTIGRIFDKSGNISGRSVLFSRFLNSEGELMARSPLSAVSILEASAMAQETLASIDLLKLTTPDFKMVEEREFSKKHIDFLYSREVTEYSVCVHLLANKINCADAGMAFSMCARLTRVALNFPKVLFEKLAEQCQISKILGVPDGHDFVVAASDGLRSYDLGIIYFLLCNGLPAGVNESEEKFKEGLNIAICSLGVSVEEYVAAMNAEGESLIETISASPIEKVRIIASAGYENFRRINYIEERLDFSKLNVPPALLGDDNVVAIFNKETNSLRGFDVESCFFELDDGMSWVNRFAEACL
ncbi:hypothetical protein SAMN05216517_110165 [Janthinobacterium sp. OK676]|uniref:hypothetical protein n=1 Tax=Janthinobacterium sp. OK676 TaxID=1855295 RepID=UPI00087E07B3|nr:hypothetical protein [Janthinobacterium sp. OK676]SDN41113.1 hypothetical protein SAMN05216517_110165 [Janthinobacterium sp. OK676]